MVERESVARKPHRVGEMGGEPRTPLPGSAARGTWKPALARGRRVKPAEAARVPSLIARAGMEASRQISLRWHDRSFTLNPSNNSSVAR